MICASVASKSKATELSEVVSRVISSGNFGAKSQLTVTINESIGTLHLSSGEEEVFAVVAAADFSRRDCFNLLAEVAETFGTVSSADRLRSCERAGELNKTCAVFMKDVRCPPHARMTALPVQHLPLLCPRRSLTRPLPSPAPGPPARSRRS